MPYIQQGQIRANRPPWATVKDFFISLWLGACLFFSTLLDPAGNHKMKPSTCEFNQLRVQGQG